jgi:hypothetical protein
MQAQAIAKVDLLLEFIALYEAWGKPDRALDYQRLRKETLAAR